MLRQRCVGVWATADINSCKPARRRWWWRRCERRPPCRLCDVFMWFSQWGADWKRTSSGPLMTKNTGYKCVFLSSVRETHVRVLTTCCVLNRKLNVRRSQVNCGSSRSFTGRTRSKASRLIYSKWEDNLQNEHQAVLKKTWRSRPWTHQKFVYWAFKSREIKGHFLISLQ